MAHWQGYIQGTRGQATRLGTKNSGFSAFVGSWEGRVSILGYTENEVDMVQVRLTTHNNGAGAYPDIILYDGPISGEKKEEDNE